MAPMGPMGIADGAGCAKQELAWQRLCCARHANVPRRANANADGGSQRQRALRTGKKGKRKKNQVERHLWCGPRAVVVEPHNRVNAQSRSPLCRRACTRAFDGGSGRPCSGARPRHICGAQLGRADKRERATSSQKSFRSA